GGSRVGLRTTDDGARQHDRVRSKAGILRFAIWRRRSGGRNFATGTATGWSRPGYFDADNGEERRPKHRELDRPRSHAGRVGFDIRRWRTTAMTWRAS